MKKYTILLALSIFLLSSCSVYSDADGQVIYHWQRHGTGVQRFVKDHDYCMEESESFEVMPNFRVIFHNMFYTEEKKLDVKADWDAQSGIWASYIPYPGADPLIFNSLKKDDNNSPKEYSLCMRKKGYTNRLYAIPTTTNVNIYRKSTLMDR